MPRNEARTPPRCGSSSLWRVVSATLLFAAACGPAGGRPATTDPLPARSVQAWQELRAAYPLHVQGIALSNRQDDGQRTLIVAEPPPWVSIENIRELCGPAATAIGVQTHALGFDGHVRDIVLSIRDDTLVPPIVHGLAELLHGSTYKLRVMTPPYSATRAGSGLDLDLQVTAAEIEAWLQQPTRSFVNHFGESLGSLEDIQGADAPLVAYSDEPGLVVWWLPSGTMIDRHRDLIHRFTVDSDLVLGARISEEGVLVVARERLLPLDVLPPLRAETIALLAATGEAELAQSYERNHPLAGPYRDDLDWAPIYLSRQLIDTEFGSLLNFTDQLLKGWSNAGETEYQGFEYPAPLEWPFSEPVPVHLDVDELTYNWNTTGAAYTIGDQDGVTFALNRTGALPVSYIPGADAAAMEDPDSVEIGRLRSAESRAYEYFSERNDPLLARVVQYTSLFQIFTLASSIGAQIEEPPSAPEDVLHELTLDLLQLIRDIEGPARDALIQDLAERGDQLGYGADALLSDFTLFEGVLVGLGDDELQTVLQLIEARDLVLAGSDAQTEELVPFLVASRFALPAVAAQQELPRALSAAIGERRSSQWIRTPTLVLSRAVGSLSGAVGGHNLSSEVSTFRTDPSMPRGQVDVRQIAGHNIVFVHPADASKLSGLVRTAGMNRFDPALLADALRRELPQTASPPVRAMSAALGSPPPPPPRRPRPPVGAMPPAGPEGGGRDMGWGWSRREDDTSTVLREEVRLARQHDPSALTIERREDGTAVILATAESAPIYALGGTDLSQVLVDYTRNRVGSGPEIQIHMRGFSAQEADALLNSARVRIAKEGGSPSLRGRLRSGRLTLDRLKNELPYDFRRARIVETAELVDRRGVTMVIEVPPRAGVTEIRPGRLHALLRFVHSLAPDRMARLKSALAQRLDHLWQTSGGGDSLRLLDEVEREMRSLGRQTGVGLEKLELKFEEELGDIQFVKLDAPYPADHDVAC